MHIKDNIDTLYWCKIFRAPKINMKNHIVGVSLFYILYMPNFKQRI